MEIKTNYKEKFDKLTEATLDKFKLKGNLIIVEQFSLEKKTKSGILLSSNSKSFTGMHENTLEFHQVVAVGEGYDDEDGNPDPSLLECGPGDIVVLPTGAVNYLRYFGAATVDSSETDKIGLAKSSDCFLVWKGQEAFDQFFKEFDGDEKES